MKRTLQILSIVLVVAVFATFNGGIYLFVTSRCGGLTDRNADVIDPADYVPFDPEAPIARLEGEASLSLESDLPVLDGAAALLPVYAAFAEAVYPADSCTFDATAQDYTPDSAMQFRNTLRSYKAVVDGDADIVLCAAPSQAQLDYAAEKGVQLKLTPVGKEAFVFLVNENNPVDSLTVDQIRGIFLGEYTNWKELGGSYRPINPLERIEGSGSQSTLVAFLGQEPAPRRPFAFLGGSIGFSFRYYTTDIIQNSGVKMLAVNGVYPDKENIRTGAYPITVQFYAVTRADEDNPNVAAMVDWILSEEGQQLIEQSGYVGL